MSLGCEEQEEKLATKEVCNGSAVPRMQEEDKELNHVDSYNSSDALKQKIQELYETINRLEQSVSIDAAASSSKGLTWTRSKSRRTIHMTIPSEVWYEKEQENEKTPHTEDSIEKTPLSEDSIEKTPHAEESIEKPLDIEPKLPELEQVDKTMNMSRKDSHNSISSASTEEESIKEIDVDIDVNDTTSVLDFVAGVSKSQIPQSEVEDNDVPVRMQAAPPSLSPSHTRTHARMHAHAHTKGKKKKSFLSRSFLHSYGSHASRTLLLISNLILANFIQIE